MQFDYNETLHSCQAVPPALAERFTESFGGENSWKVRKMANENLAAAFSFFAPAKAERLLMCSTFLQFKEYEDGRRKLQSMNSCHVRLCPICSWRRSLKVYSNVIKVADYLSKEKNRQFCLITLTVKNVEGDKLGSTITELVKGFNRLNQLKDFKQAFKGFYRGIEVTRNPKTNLYHPHIHILVSVAKSYFTSRYYLSQSKLKDMWKRACRLSYEPTIDIRKVKGDLAKACAEVAKYAVKDTDIVIKNDLDLTVEVAQTLDGALDHRRLISYGGEIAEARRMLKLEDEENGDLVHIDDDPELEGLTFKVVNCFWFSGYNDYFIC